MPLYIGELVQVTLGGGRKVFRPVVHDVPGMGWIDLRPSAHRDKLSVGNRCLIWLPGDHAEPRLVKIADEKGEAFRPIARAAVLARLGLPDVSGNRVNDMIADLLLSRGDGRWGTVRETSRGFHEIWLAGKLWEQPVIRGGCGPRSVEELIAEGYKLSPAGPSRHWVHPTRVEWLVKNGRAFVWEHLLVPFISGGVLPAQDSFTGTDGTNLETYSANWAARLNTMQILTNQAHGSALGQQIVYAWVGDTFNGNHYGQGVLSTLSADNWVGPAARVQASGGNCYGLVGATGSLSCEEVNAGVATEFGSSGTVAVNDVLKIECDGSTITPKNNGSLASLTPTAPYTDTTHTGGSAGLDDFGRDSLVDNFEADDLAGAVSITPTVGAQALAGVGGLMGLGIPTKSAVRGI